jgi:hypothetical protein
MIEHLFPQLNEITFYFFSPQMPACLARSYSFSFIPSRWTFVDFLWIPSSGFLKGGGKGAQGSEAILSYPVNYI